MVTNGPFAFRDYAYLNNARLVPMLPDWAIIDLRERPNAIRPGKIAAADFCGEKWEDWYTLNSKPESPMASFAARLRADRENAGLTIRQLADQVRISFAYVSRIESGGAGPHLSSKIVLALAKALGSDELEYFYLSNIVPAPLNNLLRDAQSRSLVRALLRTRPKPSDWDHLETALAKLRTNRPASKRKSR